MLTTIDELTATQRASVQTFFNITNEAVSGYEKLVQLNMRVMRESMQRAMDTLARGEVPGVAAAHSGDLSVIERAALYNRQVFDIVAGTQAAIVRHATAQYETQIGAVKADLNEAVQRAPVGADVAATAMNSAITAANAFYESVWKTVRQAVETAETNVEVMTRHVSNGSQAA
ncbi:phasin family protein [Paraburkholderia sp. C35]|uniref:phasin family protein n=1 Tax=Paraburkholderia sp. C35 TaxID=2126993 RepID=UPI000D698A9A|nr:phasin family protein [Paraburkholderia sp. C35]